MKDRNENRPNYKKTKLWWIPEEWEITILCHVADIIFSNVDKKINPDEHDVLLCNYTDVYYNEHITSDIDFMQGTASTREIEKYRLRRGDVVVTKDSETPNDIAVSAIVREDVSNLICGYHLAIIRPQDNRLSGEYLNKLLDARLIRHTFSTLASGVTRFGLTSNAIKNTLIPLPPLPEQRKIAEILYTWDDAIEWMCKLIDAEKRRKKALMHHLLSGMKGFKNVSRDEWRVRSLGELVEPVSRPEPKPKKAYLSIGIRSHGKGTFQKIVEFPEKVFMDTLYQVESKDLIVNITFAWEGAIAIAAEQDTGGLVSHRFPTYHLKAKEVNIDFFRNLIQTKRFVFDLGLISPGGAGRNRVLNQKDFLRLRVSVPSLETQTEIAKILKAADDEISLLEGYLDALYRQKSGLMQRLLAGEVRVKT
jgi:type I restriction enzyme S subunit